MTYPILKISLKIGIAAALAIILFEVSNIFLVYKYFKLDYYITAVAVLFLVAGYFLSKQRHSTEQKNVTNKDLLSALTAKEMAILRLIAEGKSNKEIAANNFVEMSTIKTHINNIYAKLGVSNRRQAVDLCGKLKVL